MKMIKWTLPISLITVSACSPSSSSQLKERWNGSNNPIVMMAYENEFVTQFNQLPLSGRPVKMPWSDSYWPTYQGGITYRWNWDKAIDLAKKENASSDTQFRGQLDDNEELQKLRSEVYGHKTYTKEELLAMPEDERTKLVDILSPAEKYDIFRGKFDYPTVAEERKRTNILATLKDQPNYSKDNRIPTWFGLCASWNPASILLAEPGRTSFTSEDGIKVNFAASDIKALLSFMLDKRPNQERGGFFLAERCNNDISEEKIAEIEALLNSLKIGDKELLETKIAELLELDSIDVQSKLVIASYMLAFSEDQAAASLSYQKLYEKLSSWVRAGERPLLSVTYTENQKNFAKAGTAEGTNVSLMKTGIVEAVAKPACNDTNAGAFHLALGNIIGIKKSSFSIDLTRDAEVWNQPVASYEAYVIKEFSGDEISEKVAPGTVKEVQIRTLFRYTTEAAPAWEPLSDDKSFESYHVYAGDIYRASNGNTYKAFEYKIELNRSGDIIGGSWISKTRPDFLWSKGSMVFNKEFSDIEDIYYSSLRN